ncbi:type ISP restriction/modification enzyme, partial [Luteolibacter marinus]|uniref:type ISP restriction/modification enzyme n=1 Tax=Luteolibacter marinus TaxID=2776705 RepID=UPI001D01303C
WNRADKTNVLRGRTIEHRDSAYREGLYRPFAKANVYFDRAYNDMVYRLEQLFPTAQHDNYGFSVISPRAEAEPAVLASRIAPDVALFTYTVQFFPRYRWEPAKDEGTIALDLGGEVIDGYRRIDNITDEFHRLIQDRYGNQVTKDDVFFFLYGLLHSPEYRERYAGELKQMLP